jgi:hypothetical protein
MKRRNYLYTSSFVALVIWLTTGTVALAQSSAFTYQGKLNDAGNPANGNYEMQFKLFDLLMNGAQVGTTIEKPTVAVAGGVFTVELDFGAAAFDGTDRFLEIAVRRNDKESFVTLSPRQAVTSAPYALRSLMATTADTATNATTAANALQLDGVAAANFLRLDGNGNLGLGITNSLTRLAIGGGALWTSAGWTASLSLNNGSAMGWEANASGQRFGIGQSGGGLYFFRTDSPFGNIASPANYDLIISDAGGVGLGVPPLAGLKLDVLGNGRFQTANGNINLGTPNGETGMTITGTNRADFRFDGTTLKLLAGTGTGVPPNTSGITIHTNTNVGIGTTSPGFKLQVESGGYSAILGRTNGGGVGVWGISNGAGSGGILGESDNVAVQGSGGLIGVQGFATSATGIGVRGENSTGNMGVFGTSPFIGVQGLTTGDPNGQGIRGSNGGSNTVGFAGLFNGRVQITGNLSKGGGSFMIDHPLDPANKYLYHSFVESPDMMNIYNGNVSTGETGEAVIRLPDYFSALNRDFRYQLTVIGQFAQAIVAEEIKDNQFKIKTDKPNVKVSWQVTGIRQDAYANANRIPVEADKPANERGFYLYPQVFNLPVEKSIEWARNPTLMRAGQTSLIPANTRPE